jgi:phosphinothricin acetyltransferase
MARTAKPEPAHDGQEKPPDTIITRPAEIADLPRVTEIYNYYVLNTPFTFDLQAQSVEQRRAWFDQHARTGRYRLIVAGAGSGEVIGYAATRRLRPQAAYDSSVESSVYCAPGATGRGIGTQLYRALFAALADEDVHRIFAAITLPNPASIALHQAFGFRLAGIHGEAGRKFGRYWDVGWYERPLAL